MGKRIMVALGGNAIKKHDEPGSAEEQMRNINIACKQISDIIYQGYEPIITHGNGPQIGNLAIQQELSKEDVPPQPLPILGSMTQGQIGYMIQQNLRNLIGKESRDVVTVITQVLVDKNDPAFINPNKPVGPFYGEGRAKLLKEQRGWAMRETPNNTGKSWRRVVPSPAPLGVVEGRAIRKMVDAGVIVIASGGGGIPVILDEKGLMSGVDAVIDKDLAGELLAENVNADIFLNLTDVDSVRVDYCKPSERSIELMDTIQAKTFAAEGQFPSGSMGPKVEACIAFVESGGEKAIVTSLDMAVEALKGRAGTTIVKG
jgi:carbamate kinase